MIKFKAIYVPIGVPTFHKESIENQFALSVDLLKSISDQIVCPQEPLLSIDSMAAFLKDKSCDLIILQNNSFANSEYTAELFRRFPIETDILLWTLKEPVIDGGRLRLNSLTGAYSSGNLMRHIGKNNFEYIWGSPYDPIVKNKIKAMLAASQIKKELKNTTIASIGHTPVGFGFGRGIDAELMRYFGLKHITVEARELMQRARGYSLEDCKEQISESTVKMLNLHETPANNLHDFTKLYKAYSDFVRENNVSAISSRCWPDFFVEYGTPVCSVLGLLNDKEIAASCEADTYGSLSMLIAMKLSEQSVFFGDPVSLNKDENTLTFWHCGMAACSLAHNSKGATTGVHPNRKIGPTMEFGCKPQEMATIFRIGRLPDGKIRFLVTEGEILDKPQQFLGTSLVFRLEKTVVDFVEKTVIDGWEPHFVIAYAPIKDELTILGRLLGAEVISY